MAAFGDTYALTATPATIASILGVTDSPNKCYAQQIIIQQNRGATAASFLGGSDVDNTGANAWHQFPSNLGATTHSYYVSLGPLAKGNLIDLRELYVVGTVGAANFLLFTVLY